VDEGILAPEQDPRDVFAEVIFAGGYSSAIDAVLDGRADIAAVYDPRTDNLVLSSVIDNLVKGASGQAVQIMNLKFGFEETAGLL